MRGLPGPLPPRAPSPSHRIYSGGWTGPVVLSRAQDAPRRPTVRELRRTRFVPYRSWRPQRRPQCHTAKSSIEREGVWTWGSASTRARGWGPKVQDLTFHWRMYNMRERIRAREREGGFSSGQSSGSPRASNRGLWGGWPSPSSAVSWAAASHSGSMFIWGGVWNGLLGTCLRESTLASTPLSAALRLDSRSPLLTSGRALSVVTIPAVTAAPRPLHRSTLSYMLMGVQLFDLSSVGI